MKMISVFGTYDGKNLKLKKKMDINSPKKVIITFLEDDDKLSGEKIQAYAQKGGAFDFLNEPEEDIYSDKDLKKKFK